MKKLSLIFSKHRLLSHLRRRCIRVRLLYVADPFLPIPPRFYGGIERIIDSLLRRAYAAGHEVMLLAHPDSAVSGVDLHPLVGGTNPEVKDLIENTRRVCRVIRDYQPDLLHSFARLLYLLPVLTSSLPKIMSYQRAPTPRSVRWASRLAGNSLRLVGCSKWITLRGHLNGGQWEEIPNGIDLARYTFQSEVASDAPLLFLSRMERIKGPHRAIAAARAAGHRLILAGNHASTGREADFWRREIVPWIGRDGISYVGPVDDAQKNALLGQARALLVPIEWAEPFGLVFAEALACGTPVISSPLGALPEIVEEGRTGFLGRNLTDLVAAIRACGSLSRKLCRQKAETSFSAEIIFQRYEELYHRISKR